MSTSDKEVGNLGATRTLNRLSCTTLVQVRSSPGRVKVTREPLGRLDTTLVRTRSEGLLRSYVSSSSARATLVALVDHGSTRSSREVYVPTPGKLRSTRVRSRFLGKSGRCLNTHFHLATIEIDDVRTLLNNMSSSPMRGAHPLPSFIS